MKQSSTSRKNHAPYRRNGSSIQKAFQLLLLGAGFLAFHAVHNFETSQKLNTSGTPKNTRLSHQSISQYSLSTQLAYEQSYGFWNDTSDTSWKRQQLRAQNTPLFINDQEGTKDPQKAHRWFFRNLPPNFSCPLAERLGQKGAGRWTCDPYRIGINFSSGNRNGGKENHFDCQIHSVRPVQWSWEEAIHLRLPNCQLHLWGVFLSSSSNKTDRVNGIPEWAQSSRQVVIHAKDDLIMRKSNRQMIDILKLECSNNSCSEWEKYPPARQLLLTMQGLPSKPHLFFSKLQQVAGYALFAKEPNLMNGGNSMHFSYIKLRPDFWKKTHTVANEVGGRA